MSFAAKIKKLRTQRNMTQEDLADELGLSRQSISKWEAGQGFPEAETLVRLSSFFGVTMDFLMKEDEALIPNGPDADTEQEPPLPKEQKTTAKSLLITLGCMFGFTALVAVFVFLSRLLS